MHSGAGASSAPESSEVPEMAEPSKTEQRKAEHVNIILQENVSAEYNYWNDVRLVHTALPEIDLDDVDVSVKFFGKRLEAPLIISSMTGGFGMGKEINGNLAKAAAEVGVAMGVGSQRAALEKPELEPTYAVVKDYGVPLVFANLGAPQLVPQEGKSASAPRSGTGGFRPRHQSSWRTSACHWSPRAACEAVSTSRKGSPSGPPWRGWRSRCSRPRRSPRTPRSRSCARSSRN